MLAAEAARAAGQAVVLHQPDVPEAGQAEQGLEASRQCLETASMDRLMRQQLFELHRLTVKVRQNEKAIASTA